MTHGGKRNGAGRPRTTNGRRVPKSIKVSEEMAAYLADVGTGVIEKSLRKTKAFRDWQAKRRT